MPAVSLQQDRGDYCNAVLTTSALSFTDTVVKSFTGNMYSQFHLIYRQGCNQQVVAWLLQPCGNLVSSLRSRLSEIDLLCIDMS